MIWLGISIGALIGLAIAGALLCWTSASIERDFRADKRGPHDL
jgi:hypothetical protein